MMRKIGFYALYLFVTEPGKDLAFRFGRVLGTIILVQATLSYNPLCNYRNVRNKR